MKYVSLVVTIPVTVIVVAFAVNNRGPVGLDPWPLDGAVTVPVFAAVLVPFILGFLAGGLALWTSTAARRRQARQQRQRLKVLEAEKARGFGAGELVAPLTPPLAPLAPLVGAQATDQTTPAAAPRHARGG